VNLVRNAVEAAPVASQVELVGRVQDGEAVIEVRDRGPGLAAEARASLFRPFFTTKERGTGLGLALAKKVADAHGGTLALDEREEGGTVARLAIPSSADGASSEPTASRPRLLRPRGHGGARR
jgi:signal transduction histidine kinase